LLSRAEKNREKAEAKRKRKQRQQDKAKREELKTLKELLSDAQVYSNKFIRLKYKGQGCYTCGESNPERQYQCGHFRPVGSGPNWSVRFHHNNQRLQCVRWLAI
jgi:hypothetical protein